MIEDNPTNLQLIAYLLICFGHQAIEAREGAEGVELARSCKPDLILLDIHMPRMDGYEVARQLNADPDCRQIPLIAVTALAMVGDREKILASGFSGYIAKPIDPGTFPAQINEFLGFPAPVEPTAHIPASPPELFAQPAVARGRAVVLFVDNTQTNIDLVRSTLEPSGYHVVAALSASEGLDLARRTRPDVIVSDVHMPHQDGYAFMRTVQADPELSKVPFVFLSSSVWSARERAEALKQGARKFISRPIDPQHLLLELEECLQKGA